MSPVCGVRPASVPSMSIHVTVSGSASRRLLVVRPTRTPESVSMCWMRICGYVGSTGRNAAPVPATAQTARTDSRDRGIAMATTLSGPTPVSTRRSARINARACSSAYVSRRAPSSTAMASGERSAASVRIAPRVRGSSAASPRAGTTARCSAASSRFRRAMGRDASDPMATSTRASCPRIASTLSASNADSWKMHRRWSVVSVVVAASARG
ncbi:hypothetical protein E143388_07043 [Rhodococcus opacus]|nr:hypothetical protein E143388_07043 [Rhodococcus opacus]